MPEGDISPLATAIHQLVQWVGTGRSVTTTGELRVADGLELVQLLDTGDHPCGGAGLDRLSSARNLPVLQSLLSLAVEASLLRTQRGRLIQVKKHARQAVTVEGVRRLLVENAHRTAPATLAPDVGRSDFGDAVLAALWKELSRNRHASLVVSELTCTLWSAVVPDTGAIELAPISGVSADARAQFAEMVALVLMDYAQLGLVAMDPEQTLVQLTPIGSHEADERLVPAAGPDSP
ncbi:hypothetical protein [Streptomyces sp. NPDC057580]|uniref:hypothetical protein n=1 Tax=Streptomyces sp. NPDC057580 TaxID=3346173 RepID=UPI00369A2F29